jgi:hypothetical protein
MFIGWGRWSIRTQDLWADDANAAATLARRKEQAKTHGNLRVTLWPPSSFRTYVNAVARVYKRAAPTSILVPSSERQFPAFNVFFEQVHARERSFRASANATTATTDILRPQEYQVIMRDGTPRDAFEAQRRNILALVFCTGFRAEVLRRLTHTSFREGVDDAGGRQLTLGQGVTVFAARRSRTSTTTSIGRCTLTNVRGPPTTLGLPPPPSPGGGGLCRTCLSWARSSLG